MKLPPLLDERSPAGWVLWSAGGAILLGAIAGILVPVSEIGYTVVGILGIAGGYFAGLEHRGWREGLIRGTIGGLLFGMSILVFKEIKGGEPEAHLPDPETALLLITIGFGAVLGALGGRSREKRDPAPPAGA